MGVDDRFAWAIPVYGGGFLSESDGHQGDAITSQEEADFVNTYYDGSAYFDNVTFPTLWLNGLNDHHFSLSINQKSSQAVQGPAYFLYADKFGHGNLTWRNRDEVYQFANAVVNGGPALPQVGNPTINSNIGAVTASAAVGLGSAQLFYTNDGDAVDLNDKSWASINATIAGNTVSATIPDNATLIFFAITDTEGYMATSEYLSTSDTDGGGGGGSTGTPLSGNASQSSTLLDAVASLAIDGNTVGNFGGGSVTAAAGPNAWWQLDLGSNESIGAITIFNRTDSCCLERLSDFTALIIDSNGTTTYSQTFTNSSSPSVNLDAAGALGQIIRIESNSDSTLNLAEVEVYAASTLAVTTNNLTNTLKMYPMPMQDQLVIDLNKSKEARYTINDITGKTILSGPIANGSATVDSSTLSSGLYLIRISNEKESMTKRIIKE